MNHRETQSLCHYHYSYAEKLLKLAEVLYDRCYHVINDEHEFRVINHGDCWVNNMMFRYDEYNMPIQQIFVSRAMIGRTTQRILSGNFFLLSEH